MNTFLHILFTGVIAASLLAGCNKSDKEIDNMKSEVGEAVNATKEAAGAVAEETKEAVIDAASDAATATSEAAVEAKKDAVDAIQAAKDAAAAEAAK